MLSSPLHDVVSTDRQAAQTSRTSGPVQILFHGGRCLAAWLISQVGTHRGQEMLHQGIDLLGRMKSAGLGRTIICPSEPHTRRPSLCSASSCASVPASSLPMSFEKPATSATRIAARRRCSVIRVGPRGGARVGILPRFHLAERGSPVDPSCSIVVQLDLNADT